MKKTLKLHWLEIIADGRVVYKQEFHNGLNVIAGVNGTGKSTIIDLLAYVLGYEEIEWKKVQKICDVVTGYFVIDERRFLLKRTIDEKKQNPIQYKDDVPGAKWITLPYRNSSERKSFSTLFFELLGYPATKMVNNSTLTMFQLFRLIYADQNSPADSLFNRQKEFDNKGIRKSISEFLLGIDDLESHEMRQKISELDKRFHSQSSEVKAITSFLTQWDLKSPDEIHSKIKEISSEIEAKIESLKNIDEKTNTDQKQYTLLSEISQIQEQISNLQIDQNTIQSEISDSQELINLLENSTLEIEESIEFYSIFTGLGYLYCPQCLLPTERGTADNECSLCHKVYPKDNKVNKFFLERKIEIDFQLKESKKLISTKNKTLDENARKIKQLKSKRSELEARKDLQSKLTSDTVRAVTDISIVIGESKEKIRQLSSYLERAAHLDEMNSELQKLRGASAELKEHLEQLEDKRVQYRANIATTICDLITRLLRADGGYETAFINPRNAELLFEDSKMLVDGATKFSASSEAVLKAVSRFSVFLISLMFERVRIPNFGIIDCMEDKGMLPERAHQTQNAMLDELTKFDEDSFQLIIATSMPSDRLADKKYLIGDFLQKGQHALDIKIDDE